MKSQEWDDMGFTRFTNPSGEVIRKKTYQRILLTFDNADARSIVAERKKLAEILGVPWYDLLADLHITIEIRRFPRHRRFLKYIPRAFMRQLRL